jgi:hypothetical protein
MIIEPWRFFAASATIYFGVWMGCRGRGRMTFWGALRYWTYPAREAHVGPQESQVLRYLSEVYGSGHPVPIQRALLALGSLGVLSGMVMLLDGLSRLYLETFLQRSIVSALWILSWIGLLPPVLALAMGKWRIPLQKRRFAAIRRIFGQPDRALGMALALRDRYPNAVEPPGLLAFPIQPGTQTWEAGGCAAISYAFFAISSLFVAQSPSRLIDTLGFLMALFFVPILWNGMWASFGCWQSRDPQVMDYPVSVFLRDLRILEQQDRWNRLGNDRG